MTALDVLVLIVIAIGAILGFKRGFVCETLSLIAWVMAILAIRLFQAPVASVLQTWVGTYGGAAVLAFAIVFGVTYILGRYLARSLGARTRTSILGPVDRVLGGGFGAVKGLILCTLGFLVFSLLYNTVYGASADRPDWLAKSRSYPLLNASGSAVSTFVEERQRATEKAPAKE